MPIDNRELSSGTRLVANYKGTNYVCEVVGTPEGVTRFQLEDGRQFASPSSAGKAIMNGVSCNGWRFFDIEGTVPAKPAKGEKAPKAAKAPKEPKSKAVKRVQQIKKLRIQKEAPEGQTHWFCSACQKGFFRPTGEEPATCDQGHAWMVDDELAC